MKEGIHANQKKEIMVKVAQLMREQAKTNPLLEKAVMPQVSDNSDDAEAAIARHKRFEDALHSWSKMADENLKSIRDMMEKQADNLGIDAVIEVFASLRGFESALRGVAWQVARKAASE